MHASLNAIIHFPNLSKTRDFFYKKSEKSILYLLKYQKVMK